MKANIPKASRRKIVLRVAAAHLALLLGLALFPLLRRLWRPKPPLIIPIELTMAAALPPPAPVPALRPPPRPPADPAPPAVTNRPPPEPEKQSERKRPLIEISQERVVRTLEPAPEPAAPQPVLTEEQLRRLLSENLAAPVALPGTALPDDAADLEMIRQELYRVWQQPGGRHLRGRVTEVSLSLDQQGRIVGHRIVRSSGDSGMDASVRAAMENTARIPGLSPDFPRRRPQVTIYFEVTD